MSQAGTTRSVIKPYSAPPRRKLDLAQRIILMTSVEAEAEPLAVLRAASPSMAPLAALASRAASLFGAHARTAALSFGSAFLPSPVASYTTRTYRGCNVPMSTCDGVS